MTNTRTRTRPVSGVGRKVGSRVAGNARRGWKRTLRRHPSVGVLASVLLAVLAVVLLLGGLLAENVLYFLASSLSALGTVAITRARLLEQRRQEQRRANRPTVSPPTRPREEPKPSDSPPPPSSGLVLCTETQRPIADCGCASRHVATPEGAKRYGLPVGSPMGRRAKAAKPSATARSGA